jgi:hypothetical protein
MKRTFAYAVATAAVLAVAAPAFAESSVSNMTNTLTASPIHSVGRCPAVITFTGTITVEGNITPASPVQIGYQFERSDPSTGPIKYFMISHPGSTTVSTTWTLGGPALPSYSGWEKLKAWPTRHLGFGYAFSPEAHFTVRCGGWGHGPNSQGGPNHPNQNPQ